MKCTSCKAELEPVGLCQDKNLNQRTIEEAEQTLQYDNALVLQTSGGYGMFTDFMEGEHDPVFVLCHECAHVFCKMFDPEDTMDVWHAHTHRAVIIGAGDCPEATEWRCKECKGHNVCDIENALGFNDSFDEDAMKYD